MVKQAITEVANSDNSLGPWMGEYTFCSLAALYFLVHSAKGQGPPLRHALVQVERWKPG